MMNDLGLSLFPGIGLLDAAFEEEGFCVVRGPDALWGGDIRRFHPRSGVFGIVFGGPPCQSFSSLVHLVRANGHEPRFGNLIPEFERCVEEAQPLCYLMENVPAAPVPEPKGYHPARVLMLNNRWVGAEQNRLRRFCFGVRLDLEPRSLDVSPDLVALEQPLMFVAVTGTHNNAAVTSGNGFESGSDYYKRQNTAVTSNVGGDRSARKEFHFREWRKSNTAVKSDPRPTRQEYRKLAACGTSSDGAGKVKMVRYSIAEAARLQGMPEGFLDDAPFTKEGKLKAIANGVPLPMGRAIARAVRRAMESR